MRDVIGDFKTDMLISEIKEFAEKLNKNGLKSPRPWQEFGSGFRPPKNKQEIEERLQTNFMLYRANYIVLLGAIMIWSVIMSPFSMAVLLVCAGAFALLLGWPRPLEVLGRVLTPRDKMMVASGFSFLFLLATGAMTLLIWSFLFGIMVAVTHMAFKCRSPGHRNSLNKETNLSNIGKIALEDIESPGHEDCAVNSYHSENAKLRANTCTSSSNGRD